MHFIITSGSRGCLPDHCDIYPTLDMAASALIDLFELDEERATILRRDNFIALTPADGAQYAEIDVCDCDDAGLHSDSEE